jgi:hypothetical protein
LRTPPFIAAVRFSIQASLIPINTSVHQNEFTASRIIIAPALSTGNSGPITSRAKKSEEISLVVSLCRDDNENQGMRDRSSGFEREKGRAAMAA